MSTLPYYQVRIVHSRNATARAAADQLAARISALTDVRAHAYADERDLWGRDSVVVNVSVSYTPFDDPDKSKYERTLAFADRLAALLGTDVRIHDNID